VYTSGFMDPAALEERTRLLARLFYRNKDYKKAAEYSQKWVEQTSGGDADAHILLGTSQYLLENDPEAIKELNAGIETAKRTGKPLDEEWLRILLSAYDRADDSAGVSMTYQQLTQYFPSKENWDRLLLTLQQQAGNDDRLMLNIYRLMFETGVIEGPDEYSEMADLARETGLPGEAVTVLESGLAAKQLEGKDKDRRLTQLAEAKKSADSDRKSLAESEKESIAAKSGEPDAALGMAYASYGQYDKAVEALRRGIQKGGLKRPDEVQIILGRSLLKLNQKEEAKQAFAAVPGTSKLARLAQLWAIYAGQQA